MRKPSLLLPLALVATVAACNSSTTGNSDASGGGGTAGRGAAGSGGSTGAGGAAGGSAGAAGGSGGTTADGGAGRGGGAGGGGAGGVTDAGTDRGGGGTGGGAAGAGGAAGTGAGGGGAGGTTASNTSVLQHHADLARDGVYTSTGLTRAGVGNMHIDTAFANANVTGPVYAQPLYLAGTGGSPDMIIVATEQNHLYAFNAATGAQIYNMAFGTPVTSGLPCGNINPLGITGTPVIDGTSRTIYFDAMTAGPRHLVHAVNATTGAEINGWPVDVNATASSAGTAFNSTVQNQRAALTLLGGRVFIPYSGHVGDCSGYHGWMVGINTANPSQVSAWATRAFAGGIWGSSGATSDGTSLFFATGNTKAQATDGAFGPAPAMYGDGETVFKFPTSLTPPAMATATDYFFPSNWMTLDNMDQDMGGTNPIVFNVTGANPSTLIMALGKDGNAYLLNRANLGGMNAQPIARMAVSGGAIINAAVAYTTTTATYVVTGNAGSSTGCPAGQAGGLTAIRVNAASPPTMSVAWCGGPNGPRSPAVSMSNGQNGDAIVWVVGSDNRLYGINGDNGQSVFGGGGAANAMSAVQAIQTPIVANGRVFVSSNSRVYAFTP